MFEILISKVGMNIFQAIMANNIAILRRYPGDVNILDADGNFSPLMFAITKKCLECVDVLLFEKNTNVNMINTAGQTALHLAALLGQKTFVQELLSIPNMKPNIRDKEGATALELAMVSANWEVAELMLNVGVNPNVLDRLNRPLIFTIIQYAPRLLLTVLDTKVDLSVVEPLKGMTPLMYAIQEGVIDDDDMIDAFLDKSWDLDTEDKYGLTSLEYAIKADVFDIVTKLLDEGANVKHRSGPMKYTTLRIAAEFATDDNILKLLIGSGVVEGTTNLNTTVNTSNTILANLQRHKHLSLDHDWIRDQTKYIMELNQHDKLVLKAYTHQGDALINNFIRGTFDEAKYFKSLETTYIMNPLYFYYRAEHPAARFETWDYADFTAAVQTNYKKYLQLLIQDLERIIRNAPRPEQPFVVYRGIKDAEFLMPHLGKTIVTADFESTSVAPEVALKFAAPVSGMVMSMTVAPDTPCLFIQAITYYGDEYEIILPPKVQMDFKGISDLHGGHRQGVFAVADSQKTT